MSSHSRRCRTQASRFPAHRLSLIHICILALDRGEREGFLKVSIAVEAERAGGIVEMCIRDRLLTDAQVERYGQMMQNLTDDEKNNISYEDYVCLLYTSRCV